MKNFRFFALNITHQITHMHLSFFFSFSSHVSQKLWKVFHRNTNHRRNWKNREIMGNRRSGKASTKRKGAHLSKRASGTDLNTRFWLVDQWKLRKIAFLTMINNLTVLYVIYRVIEPSEHDGAYIFYEFVCFFMIFQDFTHNHRFSGMKTYISCY